MFFSTHFTFIHVRCSLGMRSGGHSCWGKGRYFRRGHWNGHTPLLTVSLLTPSWSWAGVCPPASTATSVLCDLFLARTFTVRIRVVSCRIKTWQEHNKMTKIQLSIRRRKRVDEVFYLRTKNEHRDETCLMKRQYFIKQMRLAGYVHISWLMSSATFFTLRSYGDCHAFIYGWSLIAITLL